MRFSFLIAVIALSACRQVSGPISASRTLRVRVAVDGGVRQRDGWRERATSRIASVSNNLERDFDVRLELAAVTEWDPPQGASPEDKFHALGGTQTDGNWLFVGVVTPDTSAEPGFAVPFDNRVIVFDNPGRSDAENVAGLLHEIGHVFGAWDSTDSASLMSLPPGRDYDGTAFKVLRLTRAFDTRTGLASVTPETRSAVTRFWSESKRDASTNPFFRASEARGYELLRLGRTGEAVEELTRATDLAPGEVKPHFALASAYLHRGQFQSAATEFRKVCDLQPQAAGVWTGLGEALLGAGETADAIAAFRKAAQLAPADAIAHANLGLALTRAAAHRDEGVTELNTALRIDPKNAKIQAAIESIKSGAGKAK